MMTALTTHALPLTYVAYRDKPSHLPSFPSYEEIVNRAVRAAQECASSYAPNSLSSSDNETHFFGVDWVALKNEVARRGILQSIPRITAVFCEILVNLKNVVTAPITAEHLLPGLVSKVNAFNHHFLEVEKELLKQHVRLHRAKIKYLVAISEEPFTVATCRKVFQKAYDPADPEYRILCEQSYKEIYTPYCKNMAYHCNVFGLSYVEKMLNFLPFLYYLYPFDKKKALEAQEQKGLISSQFSDINFLELSGPQMIDLFKEKLSLSSTLSLARQTMQYEERLRCYNQPVLDDETKFTELCLTIAKVTSYNVYSEISETLREKWM